MPYTLKTGRIKVKDPVTGEYGQFDASAEPIVDDALSNTSENPVQNKVVKAALDQKYAKPQTGIPASDMSQAVQTSLGKADTALQESDIHSPLTKILDVTLSEEAALIVTEIDGEPLSVDELHMEMHFPSGSSIIAGNARVYCNSNQVGDSYRNALTNASNRYWFASWKKVGGVWVSECNDTLQTNNFVQIRRYMVSTAEFSCSFVSCITYPKITKIMMPICPAGTRICLYAR